MATIWYEAGNANSLKGAIETLADELQDLAIERQKEIDVLEVKAETLETLNAELNDRISQLEDEVQSKTSLVDDLALKYNHSFI